jgi:uncharacterized protein YbaP (TraB family)
MRSEVFPDATMRGTRSASVACAWVFAVALLSTFVATPANAQLAADENAAALATPGDESLGEVEVVGERPGPGLWRVSNGPHTLYILGTLSPLPKKMEWRSREVEGVVARAQLVIPETADVDADVGVFRAIKLYAMWRKLRRNPDGATLDAVLPPELYARFEALRTKYAPRDRGLLELRPVIAAGELWREALDDHRLVGRADIDARVRKLAKAAKVKVDEPTVKIGDPTAALQELGRVPLDAEIRCMAAALDSLEVELANARTLAEAWATGDVELIRARAPWSRQEACWAALATAPTVDDVRRRVEAAWFDAAIGALERHETTFAVARIPDLLRPGGVLERMRAKGYEIVEP